MNTTPKPAPYHQTKQSSEIWNKLADYIHAQTGWDGALQHTTNFQNQLLDLHDLDDKQIAHLTLNPNCPDQILDHIAKIDDDTYNIWVAASPALKNSPNAQQTLLQKNNPETNLTIAANPNAGNQLLQHLYTTDEDTTSTILANPSCPDQIITQTLQSDDTYKKIQLAKNPKTPTSPQTLNHLLQTKNLFIYNALSTNPHTQDETLQQLANTEDTEILLNILTIHAQTCSKQTAQQLYNIITENNLNILPLAHLDNCPEEIFHQITEEYPHPDEQINRIIQLTLASNPACPTHLLEQLAEENNHSTNLQIALNPKTPSTPQILHHLLQQHNPDINYRLATNENCDEELAGKLTGIYPDGLIDPDRHVDLNTMALLATNKKLQPQHKATLLSQTWNEIQKYQNNNLQIDIQTFIDYLTSMIDLANPNLYKNPTEINQTLQNLQTQPDPAQPNTIHHTLTETIKTNLTQHLKLTSEETKPAPKTLLKPKKNKTNQKNNPRAQ